VLAQLQTAIGMVEASVPHVATQLEAAAAMVRTYKQTHLPVQAMRAQGVSVTAMGAVMTNMALVLEIETVARQRGLLG
jgi:hypothetical protein